MLFTTVAALLFPVAILAAPAGKPDTDDEHCKPISYTLTEYVIAQSQSYYFVSFNVRSSYTTNSQAIDRVTAGANCEADGMEIRSGGNLCNMAGKRFNDLVFDLRAESGDTSYRLYHKWQCNGATWISDNDVDFPDLECKVKDSKEEDTVTCSSKPIIFTPQNVRKISAKDEKVSNKTKDAKPAQAAAKPAHCHDCKPSASL